MAISHTLKYFFIATVALTWARPRPRPQESLSDMIDRIIENPDLLQEYDDSYPTETAPSRKTTTDLTASKKQGGPKEAQDKEDQEGVMATEMIASLSVGGSALLVTIVAVIRCCSRTERMANAGVAIGDAAFRLFLTLRGLRERFRVPLPQPTGRVLALPAP